MNIANNNIQCKSKNQQSIEAINISMKALAIRALMPERNEQDF